MINQAQMLAKAITLAATYHEEQFDKGGKPYILHPLTVMHKLKSCDYELQQIAVMHDLIEDTGILPADLTAMGFSDRVVDALKLLTHLEGESYTTYIEGIATSVDATFVKLEDLRHNSDLRRLKGVTDKDLQRIGKYTKAYNFLEKSVKKLLTRG